MENYSESPVKKALGRTKELGVPGRQARYFRKVLRSPNPPRCKEPAMHHKRFTLEAEAIRMPQPYPQQSVMTGFVLCPLSMMPGMSIEQLMLQQMLYQRAF